MTDFEEILIPEKYRDKTRLNENASKTIELPLSNNVSSEGSTSEEDKWTEILSKVKVGIIVSHKKFGDGVITWIGNDKKYFRVKFSDGEKQFVFPNAFVMEFLTIK